MVGIEFYGFSYWYSYLKELLGNGIANDFDAR